MKAFAIVSVLAISFSVFAACTFLVDAKAENSWMPLSRMPSARAGFGVAEVNGKIYAMGGWNKNQTNFLAVNEEYDPAANAWVEKAPMPTARVSFATAVYQNKVYTFGGQVLDVNGKRIVIDVTEVYDPATDTWTRKAPLPRPAEDFGAAVIGDRIYVIGTQTDVYDPATDSWSAKAPIPKAIAHSAYAVLDDEVYVISGNFHGNDPSLYEPINLNQIYNSQRDEWRTGASIPTSVASAAGVATVGAAAPKAVYVVGGLVVSLNEAGGYVFNPQSLVQVYFPENNSWSLGASMPTARYSLSAVAVDDAVYVLGGSYSMAPPDSADNELYLPYGWGTMQKGGLPLGTVLGALGAVAIAVVVIVVVYAEKRHRTKT
ncbi:MAG: Kelch repeat-containing protein [Candidatus Bathyarchaeia archaeon]